MNEKKTEPGLIKKTLTSRKSFLFVVLFVLSTIFMFTGYANFVQWADFMKWIFGTFVVGNVARHHVRENSYSNGRRYMPDSPTVDSLQDRDDLP